MNFLIAAACESSGILSVILFVKTLLNIICIGVPIILILMAAIDLGKIVMSGDTKKPMKSLIARMIGACGIFFVPFLVNLLIDLVGVFDTKNFTVCMNNANTETITYYKSVEKEREALEMQKLQTEQEAARKEREEIAKKREEARKKNEEKAKEEENNNGNYPGSNYDRGDIIEGNATVASQVVWDRNDCSRVSNLTVSQLIAILNSHGGKAVRYVPLAADLITAENKYQVNVFFLLGVSALESGWINEEHSMISKCNNLGGVCATASRPSYGCFKNSNCEFAYYASRGEFVDSHARLLGQSYLNPNGALYEGKRAEDVVIHYCPGCTEWPNTANAIAYQLYAHVSRVM